MLGKRRTLNQHDAADRQRKALDNPVYSHARSFLGLVRISAQVYNDLEDVERLGAAVLARQAGAARRSRRN